ncbi:ATP synthase subunit-domain-containing protein [Endogone sp. FLAS-F59071]|nr:ATP synthase subunit-domain-containing protein [Endogone sp. FLAS-F59071]|eukprot:RUS22939.1 ATP synthase subunit-domain-containing protein [Endogone sp. FLAS-F59071]
MSSRALNDDEVYSEMKKMVAFIKQEALEKAREIKIKKGQGRKGHVSAKSKWSGILRDRKTRFVISAGFPCYLLCSNRIQFLQAEEEFNIEKVLVSQKFQNVPKEGYSLKNYSHSCPLFTPQAKVVRQEAINIDATFQRKIKQAEVQKRIAQSNHINKSRLRVLQARQRMLEELFAETRAKLPDVTRDITQYRALLKDLILQGFYALMEHEVVITCRQKDAKDVKNAIEEARRQYKEALGSDVDAKVDQEFLPQGSAGGVILSAQSGKIKVNNTLETRLDILEENMLPQIRVLLFGHSPNRKFFN